MTVPTTDLPTTTATLVATDRRDARSWLFRASVAVIAVFVLTGPGGVSDLAAAFSIGAEPTADEVLHRWHHIDVGAYLSLLTVGTLLVAAWRPRRATLAVQVALVSLASFAAVIAASVAAPAQVLIPLAVVSTILMVTYPEPRALMRRPDGRSERVALLGAVVATPFLIVNLWDNLARQLGAADVHAALGHWGGAAALAWALLVTTWAGTRVGATARGLRAVAAVTLVFLGGAASSHAAHDGAWPAWGAATAVVAAVLLAASTVPRQERS